MNPILSLKKFLICEHSYVLQKLCMQIYDHIQENRRSLPPVRIELTTPSLRD